MSKQTREEKEHTSKDKILNAAEKIFSEKGFDGARISKIGKAAGVNPSLLYYYYEDKEDILHALMGRAIKETENVLDRNFAKITEVNEKVIDNFIRDIMLFLENKKQILKIMLTELLKGDHQNYSLFELFEPLYQKINHKIKELGGQIRDESDFLSEIFFIFTVPITMHIVIGDKWSQYKQIGIEKTRTMIFRVFKEVIQTGILRSKTHNV